MVIAELSQEVRAQLNFSHLRFAETAVLEPFVNQNDISAEIGTEIALLAQYRPLLTNNVQIQGGLALFLPGAGFMDLYETGGSLFSAFLQLTLGF